MSEKIRLGIIGIGNMGTGHMKNYLAGKCPEVEVIALADHNPARIAWAKENYPAGITYFEDAMEMLDSGLINACQICVPHYDHPRFAIACIERGIHVMVEKPAGVYTKQVREMNEVAAAHPEVVYGMMFNQRTNPIYRKMREIVTSGKYGQIRRTNWIITDWYRSQCYYDSGDWRATWSGEGGGVLLNQCPHQLDLWQWICGMPTKIEAHLQYGKWHDIEVEDDVSAYVEYENGATGVFITTTGDGCGTNRFEIQLDGAKLVASAKELTVFEFDVSEPEFTKINKLPFAHVKTVNTVYKQEDLKKENEIIGHAAVVNAWADAILHGGKLIASGFEGIRGLTISNAMHLSSFTGKMIELPFDEDLYYSELMKRVAVSRRKTNVNNIVADTSSSYGGTSK